MVDRVGAGRRGTRGDGTHSAASAALAALVPAGFALGAALCALLLRGAPAAVAVDLRQPLAVVTYWQHFGALMWMALFVAIAVASVGYVAVLREAPRRGSAALRYLSATTLLRYLTVTAAVACVAALAFPVVFSSDVYAYAGYGQMALHGINPYAHARITLHDPLLDAMLWQWGNPPPMCVYGPAFVWLAKAMVALLLPLGVAAPLWGFRVLACLALVACAPLAYAAFAPLGETRRRMAAAGIALNPVLIWSCAEGHNDAIVLAIVLAGFVLAARSRVFAGALVMALGALVKAPALGAAAGLVLAAWRDPVRRMRAAGGALLGAVMVAAIAVPLEYGVRAHLAPGGHYFPQFSLQYVSPPLAFALSAVFAFIGVRAMLRGKVQGAVHLAFAGWLAIPNPYPWYAVWLVPVAFLAEDPRAMWALLSASLLIVLRYYGDATTDLSPALSDAIVALQFVPPLLLLLSAAYSRPLRPDLPESRTADLDFAMPRRS